MSSLAFSRRSIKDQVIVGLSEEGSINGRVWPGSQCPRAARRGADTGRTIKGAAAQAGALRSLGRRRRSRMEIPVPVQPSWLRRASAPLPGRLFDQRFGEGLLEAELSTLCPAALAPYYLRAPSVALPAAQVPGLGEGRWLQGSPGGWGERGEGCPRALSRVKTPAPLGWRISGFLGNGISEVELLKGAGGPQGSESP